MCVNKCARSGWGRVKAGITVPILRVMNCIENMYERWFSAKMGDEMAQYECDNEGRLNSHAMLV